MLHLVMKRNAVVPAHSHKGMAEALYVVEGDFTSINRRIDQIPTTSRNRPDQRVVANSSRGRTGAMSCPPIA